MQSKPQGHFGPFKVASISRKEVQQAIAEWEAAHGPVPKVPYDPRAEWRPSCDFHNYSAFESPIALELGVSGALL